MERALPLLREASRLAVEARAPVIEAVQAPPRKRLDSFIPALISGDLDRLCSVVFDLTRSVPAAERAVAEVRPRVERARKRDEFNAKRFRRHESAADARASRELFITAVLEHFPDITRSEHAWGCVAVALGFAARGDWDKGTWESTKKSWAAEVRRLVKARRPR